MVRYSVLIPQRDAAEEVGQRLPQLCQVLDDLLLPYEIICIDDASPQPAAERLPELLGRFAHLRVLRFEQPRGTAAALTAGIASSRGEILIAMDVRSSSNASLLTHLVSRLSRHDAAVACHRGPLWQSLWQHGLWAARVLIRAPRLHNQETLLWAARRSAIQGLTLPRGSFRLLETILSRRGQRVCRVLVADGCVPYGQTYRPGLLARLAAWCFARRFEPHLASELRRGPDGGGDTFDSPVPRWDSPVSRPIPQPFFQPKEKQPGEST